MKRTDLPKGKGIYVWIIQQLLDEYGSFERIAEVASYLHLDWVAVKIANGVLPYNVTWTATGPKDNTLIKPFIAALQAVGIEVWGWHYIYGNIVALEIRIAVSRVRELGVAGYIANAEGQYKGKFSQARAHSAGVREELPDTPMGLTSYRWPTLHPRLPFREFMENFDFHNPQVYWQGATNPGEQLIRSIRELQNISKKPVIPIGSAYGVGDWLPTVQQLDEFYTAVFLQNLVGYCFWAWHTVMKNPGFIEAIRAQSLLPPEPTPPPTPGVDLVALEADVRLAVSDVFHLYTKR